jgi:hypothetical protein
MATQYPYFPGGAAGLFKTFEQLRKNPPQTIDAAWFKRFGIASANESYVITILRFLGLYDDDGKLVESATDFLYGDPDKFAAGLEDRVRNSYSPLFADHDDAAWTESKEVLNRWFRVTDKTSELTGGRQASTFLHLAALAGHGVLPTVATTSGSKTRATKASVPAKKTATKTASERDKQNRVVLPDPPPGADPIGLTVRIEVNLPADGTPENYDAIFASIRKHLIDRG